MNCTRCQEGFLNLEQIPDEDWALIDAADDFHQAVQAWIKANDSHDVSVCDCCGNGENWNGEPGLHYYNPKDPCSEGIPGCI